MIIPSILELIDQYRGKALGWKVSGAGGGGYLILVANTEIEDALRIKIRRAG
jgi:mevalonate kinase